MIRAVEAYLRLRRMVGLMLESTEYLLRSFAYFAERRKEPIIRAQTAIDWAALAQLPRASMVFHIGCRANRQLRD
jgi:hypothetical protein